MPGCVRLSQVNGPTPKPLLIEVVLIDQATACTSPGLLDLGVQGLVKRAILNGILMEELECSPERGRYKLRILMSRLDAVNAGETGH